MITVDDLLKAYLIEERSTLESIASVLMSRHTPYRRVDDALGLVRERLHTLKKRPSWGGHDTTLAEEPEPFHWSAKAQQRENQPVVDTVLFHADLIGDSLAMRRVNEAIHRLSRSQATVLLRGESGTGKELVAHAIHRHGSRAEKPFVPLHCAAVSEALLESELFGHERGAFTGAVGARKGRFESADGGTLFLDEIGDIPLATQVKLLRVLQNKCFERVGGSQTRSVDVRVISATHSDLEAMVRTGTFREDLYYRLNVVPIDLPPLRDREKDIPLLIDHFLSRIGGENRGRVRLGRDLLGLMVRYHWPGNVRELQNCIERLAVMADSGGGPITLETIPSSLRGYFMDMRQVTDAEAGEAVGKERSEPEKGRRPLTASLQEIEKDRLVDALRRTGWIQVRTARELGLTARQVAYKMKKYGLKQPGHP